MAAEWWMWWQMHGPAVRDLALALGVAAGLPLLAWRALSRHRLAIAALQQAATAALRHDAQIDADRERHLSESFARAIEALGSGALEARIGAIYVLDRIAWESPADHWPIMETLAATVRERARPAADGRAASSIAGDIQAALTVLGRRVRANDPEGARLSLARTDLRGADLRAAWLAGADLTGARLDGADLAEACLAGACVSLARLEGARLQGVNLREAKMEAAQLMHARLDDADLAGADLRLADLRQASLAGARLDGARLDGADLGGCDASELQLRSAHLNSATRLPERPAAA